MQGDPSVRARFFRAIFRTIFARSVSHNAPLMTVETRGDALRLGRRVVESVRSARPAAASTPRREAIL